MKRTFKYILTALLIVAAAVACRDEDLTRTPDMSSNIGAVTKITRNPDKTFFNAFNTLADEVVEFTIDVDGFDVTEISSVDVVVVFTENDRVYDPFQNIYVDSVYAPVTVKTITSFPSTVQIAGSEIAQALGMNSEDFEPGDVFNATFPINTADGRRLTVALNSELCNQPGQPSFGGCNFQWVVTCPSAIKLGDYKAVTTATSTDDCPPDVTLTDYEYDVTLTLNSPGRYIVSDFFGGAYIEWYGDCYGYDFETPGSFIDVCNSLDFNFADEFNSPITGTGAYDPNTGIITYTWTNGFGDTGTTVLTPL